MAIQQTLVGLERAFANRALAMLPLLLLSSCSLFPGGGSSNYASADKYIVGCDYEYTTIGYPQGRGDISNDIYMCSRGTPNVESRELVCVQKKWEAQRLLSQRGINWSRVDVSAADRVALQSTGTCQLSVDQPSNVGVSSQPLLSSGAASGMHIVRDPTGVSLGQRKHVDIGAKVANSTVRVSAKFAAWRSAETTATGFAQLDTGHCEELAGCTIVLRYLELAITDFTIVRPTVFARDATVRDARLYSVNDVAATLDRDGRFRLSDIELMVSAVANGEQGNHKYPLTASIFGRVTMSPAAGSLPLVTLYFSDRASRLGLSARLVLESTHFLGRLQNVRTGRCLASGPTAVREERGTVENCVTTTRVRNWRLQREGDLLRIRNPRTNSCLNLKRPEQHRSGGQVSVVGCSAHEDQRWRLIADRHVQHVASGMCLNVHGGRENRDGGYVSVYRCASTDDQRWALRLPGSVAPAP